MNDSPYVDSAESSSERASNCEDGISRTSVLVIRSGTAVRTGSHPGPRSAGTAIIGGVPKWAVPSSSRIRETVEVAWGRQLREIASTFSLNEGGVEDSFHQLLYSMKVFEPAANLCQAEAYRRGRCRLS